jgi:hypothetical protein
MVQSVFGAGFLFGIPSGANPTPIMFGAVQDTSVDFSFDLKQLYGQNQFALEQARGKGKIDIKSSVGRFDPNLFNQIYFGQTTAAGEVLNSVSEAQSIPASSPYTVTAANGATFKTDLGVYSTTLGKFLVRVASGPATGQYAVNTSTGVYTFAAADTGGTIKLNYTYSSASTGTTLAAVNPTMGTSPIFSLQLVNSFKSKSISLTFNAVQSSKLSLPMKLDDFSVPALDMSAQDDGTGNVFTWTLTG